MIAAACVWLVAAAVVFWIGWRWDRHLPADRVNSSSRADMPDVDTIRRQFCDKYRGR